MKAEIGDLGWEADGASDSTVMILTCPECATSYFVDDSRIAATGRTVKCSNCGARWRALPEGAEEPIVADPPPQPIPAPFPTSAADELVIEGPSRAEPTLIGKKPAAPRREANGKVVIWVASALMAAGLIASAITFRAKVVELFPASQIAYAGLGMPVSSLALEKVRAEATFEGGRPALAITGQVRNLRDAPANSPPLRVSLLDRFGKAVATKIAKPISAAVPSHAIRYFSISIVDPPSNIHDLTVSFEPAKKGAPAVVIPVETAPQPAEAKPLPPGSPDALPVPQ